MNLRPRRGPISIRRSTKRAGRSSGWQVLACLLLLGLYTAGGMHEVRGVWPHDGPGPASHKEERYDAVHACHFCMLASRLVLPAASVHLVVFCCVLAIPPAAEFAARALNAFQLPPCRAPPVGLS